MHFNFYHAIRNENNLRHAIKNERYLIQQFKTDQNSKNPIAYDIGQDSQITNVHFQQPFPTLYIGPSYHSYRVVNLSSVISL